MVELGRTVELGRSEVFELLGILEETVAVIAVAGLLTLVLAIEDAVATLARRLFPEEHA